MDVQQEKRPDDRSLPPSRRAVSGPAPLQLPRRSLSFSSPPIRSASSGTVKGPDPLVATLYNHPAVKITAFTAGQGGSLAPSADEPQPGTLSASSQLERTIAIGPFRIYRAPGSVAFLSCGSVLQPILPKSQCWRLHEDNSRFVLQVRRPQYWRIEVPISHPEHVERALALREVLDRILLFEKTECPFHRTFTVALPDRPKTAQKKRPWTPVGKNLIASAFQAGLSPPSPSPMVIHDEKRRAKSATRAVRSMTVVEDPSGAIQGCGETQNDEGLEHEAVHVACDMKYPNESASRPGIQVSQPLKNAETEDGSSTVTSPLEAAAPAQGPELDEAGILHLPSSPSEVAGHEQEAAAPSTREAVAAALFDPLKLPQRPVSPQRRSQGSAMQTIRGNTTSSDHEEGSAGLGSARTKKESVEATILAKATRSTSVDDGHGEAPGDGTWMYEGCGSIGAVSLKKKRMSRMLAGRSAALQPKLTVTTTPPSQSAHPSPVEGMTQSGADSSGHEVDDRSSIGSADSFHTVHSWHSPTSTAHPSPPLSQADLSSPHSFPHPHQDILLPPRDGCVDGATKPADDADALKSQPRTDDCKRAGRGRDTGQTGLSRRPELRQRPRTSGASSSGLGTPSLPTGGNPFTPQSLKRRPSRFELVAKLPGAILHKTVELMMGPPSHLVNLMLKVAARIAAGEWRGLVYGLGEGGESIPVQWDYSDSDMCSWGDKDDHPYASGRSPCDDDTVAPRQCEAG